MPSYNPNSIWGSKEKKYSYEPPADPRLPKNAPGASNGAPHGPSFFQRHRLMFFAIGLLLGLGLIALVVYLILPPPTPNIAISFSDPGSVTMGQPFPLSITVSNESDSVLKNAQLTILLPAGISFAGQNISQRAETEQIDTLSSQTINPPQDLELIATGSGGAQSVAGTAQNISVTLTYETATTGGTQYETDADTDVLVGEQPAITLHYNAPSSIFSGQNFALVVNYENDTTGTLQGVQLAMQYPPAYTFVDSTTGTIDAADDTWNIGTLAPDATGTLTITGNIVGPAGAQYELNGSASDDVSGQNYPFDPVPATFSIAESPLSIAIAVNDSSTYVATLGDDLDYTLTYTNNSDVTFQDLNIEAGLAGQMYDAASLQTDGSFDSNTDTITWNAANDPQLLSLAAGQSGSVTFSVDTQSAFPIRSAGDKDYELKVSAQIGSPTVPPDTAGSSTLSAASLTSKVGGVITVAADGYAHEPTAAIANSGPYPPQVGQATEYTVHWDVTNYSTDASSVTVSAYLQSGTTFTGQVESNVASSTPTYDPATGLVRWTVPWIPATTGVIGPPAEAVFQVSNTPSITQAGQYITLLGPTTLTATDMFTGAALQATSPAVDTSVPDDKTVDGQNGTVVQ